MASPSVVIGIGKRLRAARETSGRSLDDLSSATRINKAFLVDIENGRAPQVPEIYFRAFVKSFAMEVGEDPVELLEMLKETGRPVAEAPTSERGAPVTVHSTGGERQPQPRPSVVKPGAAGQSGSETVRRQAMVLLGLASLVVVGLLMSVYWLRNERDEKGVQEISFSEVVKEQTAKLQPAESSEDTARVAVPTNPAGTARTSGKGDSLRLQAVTSESVWVHIAIDGASPMEYTLPPGYQLEWKASKEFAISLGNPRGIAFTFDGKKLGTLGEGKKPVKNIILSRTALGRH